MADEPRPQEDRHHVRDAGAVNAAARVHRCHADADPAGGRAQFGRLSAAGPFRSDFHLPRHHHGFLRGVAFPGRPVQCRRSTANRCAPRRFPVHELGVPVADRGRRSSRYDLARHRQLFHRWLERLPALLRSAVQSGRRGRLLDLGDPGQRGRLDADRNQFSRHDRQAARARHAADDDAAVHLDGAVYQHLDRVRLPGFDRCRCAAWSRPLSRHALFHRLATAATS